MAHRLSNMTVVLDNPPTLKYYASVVGKTEGNGPMGRYFDETESDEHFGKDTWEQAESELLRRAVARVLTKASIESGTLDCIVAGDLLNQCTGSTFALKDFGAPVLGVYGACSTMAESLLIASIMTEAGAGGNIVAATSSHFCSAERQFRSPMAYGGLRTPTAQHTCTAAGAVIVSPSSSAPFVRAVTVGRPTDMGVTDANNMGAAMAPAACDTIKTFLNDTHTKPEDYDYIVTGDLGKVGSEILCTLMAQEGFDIERRHRDCGLMMFDDDAQDTHAGGSGCGCSASILCGYFLDRIKHGEIRNILFAATGALMSPTSSQQGETIPSISHLLHISKKKED